jgi:hypothetical protein
VTTPCAAALLQALASAVVPSAVRVLARPLPATKQAWLAGFKLKGVAHYDRDVRGSSQQLEALLLLWSVGRTKAAAQLFQQQQELAQQLVGFLQRLAACAAWWLPGGGPGAAAAGEAAEVVPQSLVRLLGQANGTCWALPRVVVDKACGQLKVGH